MMIRFYDMCSGGTRKEEWDIIYIEAGSQDEAELIFYNRFGHNPNRVSCTCCGRDYSISVDSLMDREDERNKVLVITKDEISDDERQGDLPQQGFIWV